MSKPMTVNEAVDHAMNALRFTIGEESTRVHLGKCKQALAVLNGKRLCDEAEAREIIEHLYETAVTYDALGGCEVCHSARRWLAEHGGE